ncbi:MAG: RhuM family protein [Candidatus Moraniibacteriota bacterium]
MTKKLTIRNSTAEFLIFTTQSGKDTIDVRVEDENIWLTQKLIAKLFGVEINTINYHLKEIFKNSELEEKSVIRKFGITADDGKTYQTSHYSLTAIIAIGFRVNSQEATNFRKWASGVLKDFTLRGYVLDDIRLKNGAYLSKEYFRDLVLQIRDIRESERNFYQIMVGRLKRC